MKRLIFLVIILLGLGYSSQVLARPCIETWGQTSDGEPVHVVYCLAYDQPTIDKGIYKVEMKGGTFYNSTEGTFVSKNFGSNINPNTGLRTTGTGFLVLSDQPGMFYIFFSEIIDGESYDLGVAHDASIYVFGPAANGFQLIGWWYTVYVSMIDLLANEWFWVEPDYAIIFHYFEE